MSYSDVFGSKTIPVTDEGYVAHNITASGTLVWPDKYDGTNLLAANIVDLTTTAGLTVTFPPANQASTGQSLIVRNIGANSVELLDADGGSITVVASGEVKILFVRDNSSAAGTWAVFTLGTGTSAADASALASYGLKALSGKLTADHPYIEKSGNYTVQASDRAKVINVTSGTVTISLPQASTVTAGFFVLIRNSAIGTITVDPFNTELVNGELTFDLNPAESALFVCSGSGWYTVGYGRDVQFAFSEFVVDAAAGSVALSSSDVAGRMIRVGGTAAGNIVVTLPAIDNIYFVNVENGMGAFNVTFTTGAGTTVVLNANSRTAIYSDGTNVTSAITTALTSTIALDDGSASTPTLSFVLDTDTGLFRRGDNELGIAAGGNEIAYFSPLGLTLNSTYNLLIGHDSLSAVLDGVATPALQVHGATASTASLLAARWSADINGSFYSFGKSRSGVVGTHTIVQSGDQLGRLEFAGSDGVNFIGGARIVAEVDGTPGLNDMPGRLVFSTTSDGASTPTERMRIDSAGLVTLTGTQVISTSSASDALRITQTGAGNALVVEDSTNPDSTPFVINSAGFIGQGLTVPATNFHATSGTGAYEMRLQSDNASSGTSIATLNLKATNTRSAGILWSDSADAEMVFIGRPYNSGSNSPDLIFRMAGTEAARIDSSGKLVIGHTSVRAFNYASEPRFQVNGTSQSTGAVTSFVAAGAAANISGSILAGRSRGTQAAPTIVLSGDDAGRLQFEGYDGAALIPVAAIVGQVDGTPGLNDMPGRLVFSTTADGSSSLTERMRITNTGRVLVGTTTDDGSSRLQVSGTGAFGGVGAGGLLRVTGLTSGKVEFGTAASTGGSLIRGYADAVVFNDHDGTPADGTSSVNSRFYRGTTTTGATSLQIYLGDGTANQNHQLFGKGGNSYLVANNGNLLIGTVTDNTVGKAQVFGVLTVSGTAYFAQVSTDLPGLGNTTVGGSIRSVGTVHVSSSASNSSFNVNADTTLISMRRSGVQVGSISVTTTATAYNTSSDYRLKLNPQPLIDSGAFIDALQPRTWNWAQNGEQGTGFIAHELQAVSPSSVVGEKDAVDENGDPIYQAVEYGSAEMIAMMVAELKSLRQRVAALEQGA